MFVIFAGALVSGADRLRATLAVQQHRAGEVSQPACERCQAHSGEPPGIDRSQQLPRVLQAASSSQVELPAG